MKDQRSKEILSLVTKVIDERTPFIYKEKNAYFLSDEFAQKIAIENGIMIPPLVDFPEPEILDIEGKDVTLYSLSGFSYYFGDAKTAEKIANFIKGLSPVIIKVSYDEFSYDDYISRLVKTGEVIEITTRLAYSRKLYPMVKEKLKLNKQMEDNYEKKKTEDKQKFEEYRLLAEILHTKVHEMVNKCNRWSVLLATYKKYVDVLGQDKADIAFVKIESPGNDFMIYAKSKIAQAIVVDSIIK